MDENEILERSARLTPLCIVPSCDTITHASMEAFLFVSRFMHSFEASPLLSSAPSSCNAPRRRRGVETPKGGETLSPFTVIAASVFPLGRNPSELAAAPAGTAAPTEFCTFKSDSRRERSVSLGLREGRRESSDDDWRSRCLTPSMAVGKREKAVRPISLVTLSSLDNEAEIEICYAFGGSAPCCNHATSTGPLGCSRCGARSFCSMHFTPPSVFFLARMSRNDHRHGALTPRALYCRRIRFCVRFARLIILRNFTYNLFFYI